MRVLLLDAAPGELLDRRLECLLGHGVAVTLNLRRVGDQASAWAAWTDRVGFADFDAFDESALIAEITRWGRLSRGEVPGRRPVARRVPGGGDRSGTGQPAPGDRPGGVGHRPRRPGRAARHGVTVTHTPGSNATAVAEFALAQLLALTRNLSEHNEAAHQGSWGGPAAVAVELSELTLGVLGLGRIVKPWLSGRPPSV